MKRVISFDVFDTILTRAVGSPRSVFLLLGLECIRKGDFHGTPGDFANSRVEAERAARAAAGMRDVTLAEIYESLDKALALSAEAKQRIMASECDLEASLLRVVGPNAAILERERQQGHRIVFASDMYLPRQWIETQLRLHNVFRTGDGCYVSSELGSTKASGGLFSAMAQGEQVPVSRLLHRGNNAATDVRKAREAGVRAEYLNVANANRFEAILEKYADATNGLSSLMAGASRLARLSVPAVNSREQALRDVAAGVAGPTIAAYVIWALRQAREMGLKRLYFVSRDGEILLKVAKKLAAKIGIDCELRYLYGSRHAWHGAAIREIGDRELLWICERGDCLTVRALLDRVSLSPTDITDVLEDLGFPAASWDDDLSTEQIQSLAQRLTHGGARRLVLERAAPKRDLAIAYLRQEGLGDPIPWAVVDLGWRGRMQASLADLLSGVAHQPPRGFYFALTKGAADESGGQKYAYLSDARSRDCERQVPQMTTILEAFCAGSQGLTVGYSDKGRITPVLKQEQNRAVLGWGLEIVQQTIESFSEHLCLLPREEISAADMRDSITEILNEFWLRPRHAEAVAWGSFPFEDSQTGATSFCLARPASVRDSFTYLLTGAPVWNDRAHWRQGAWAARSGTASYAIHLAKVCRRVASKLSGLCGKR